MRIQSIFAPMLLASIASTAAAQSNPECSSYGGQVQVQNVCDAAVDGTRLFHPVAGLLVSGGNPVIGTAQTLGGLPHVFIGVRVNATQVKLPDLNYDGTGDVPLGDEMLFPAPLVEAGLGLWKGLNRGLLSVDLLASAQLLPTNQIENLTVDKDARKIGDIALGLGYGARVGIIRGTFPLPSVSVSVMKRTIPRVQYGDISDLSQDYQYAVDLQATNLRAMASTRLLFINVAAGLGWDKYTGDATAIFRDPTDPIPLTNGEPPINIAMDETRTMAFLDVVLDFPVLKIAAEIGYQAGKNQNLPTTFDGIDDTAGRLFGGVGVRLGF